MSEEKDLETRLIENLSQFCELMAATAAPTTIDSKTGLVPEEERDDAPLRMLESLFLAVVNEDTAAAAAALEAAQAAERVTRPKPNGRKKKAAERIVNSKQEAVCFSKRRDGVIRKEIQLEAMTGCRCFLILQRSLGRKAHRSTKQFAYASEQWRPLLGSPLIASLMELLPTDEAVPLMYSNERREWHVENKELECQHSKRIDWYCDISPVSLISNRHRVPSPVPAKKLSEAPPPLPPIERESSGSDVPPPPPLLPPPLPKLVERKKRSGVTLELIADTKRRSTTLCKRRGGLMRKLFELQYMTGGGVLFIMLHSPPSSVAISNASGSPAVGLTARDHMYVYASPHWRAAVMKPGFLDSFMPGAPELRSEAWADWKAQQAAGGYLLPTAARKVEPHQLLITKANETRVYMAFSMPIRQHGCSTDTPVLSPSRKRIKLQPVSDLPPAPAPLAAPPPPPLSEVAEPDVVLDLLSKELECLAANPTPFPVASIPLLVHEPAQEPEPTPVQSPPPPPPQPVISRKQQQRLLTPAPALMHEASHSSKRAAQLSSAMRDAARLSFV